MQQRPDYNALLEQCSMALARVEANIERHKRWRRMLLVQKMCLLRLARQHDEVSDMFEQLALPSFDDLERPATPHVKIIEDILRERGPLHVGEIAELARMRGVPLDGKKSPPEQVREKLNNSRRFHLFGSNIWGLPEHTDPSWSRFDRVVAMNHGKNGNGHREPVGVAE